MTDTAQHTGEVVDPAGISTDTAFAVLDEIDLNHVVIEDIWGETSVDWLITQHAIAETSNEEIEHRRELAGAVPARSFAPIHQLPSRPERRRARLEQRAA